MLDAQGLYGALLTAYGTPRWWSEDPFTVMFQAVLVQNTAWRSVEKVTAALPGPPRPEAVLAQPASDLEALIRPCGFHRAKAQTLRSLAAWYLPYRQDPARLQAADTQTLRRELLALRGVGEETADVILLYALYRPAFVVDAYTRRLLRRLGHDLESDAAVRDFFTASLPSNAACYGACHWLILEHCIAWCRKAPRCAACPLRGACPGQP